MFLSKLFLSDESEIKEQRLYTCPIVFKGRGKLTHIKTFANWKLFKDYVNTNFWLSYDIYTIFDDSIKEGCLDPPVYDLEKFYN